MQLFIKLIFEIICCLFLRTLKEATIKKLKKVFKDMSNNLYKTILCIKKDRGNRFKICKRTNVNFADINYLKQIITDYIYRFYGF